MIGKFLKKRGLNNRTANALKVNPRQQSLNEIMEAADNYSPLNQRTTDALKINPSRVSKNPSAPLVDASSSAPPVTTPKPAATVNNPTASTSSPHKDFVDSHSAGLREGKMGIGGTSKNMGKMAWAGITSAAGGSGWSDIGKLAGSHAIRGAIGGAAIGGTMEAAQGGSFWNGAKEGAFNGAIGWTGARMAQHAVGRRNVFAGASNMMDTFSKKAMMGEGGVSKQASSILNNKQMANYAKAFMNQ